MERRLNVDGEQLTCRHKCWGSKRPAEKLLEAHDSRASADGVQSRDDFGALIPIWSQPLVALSLVHLLSCQSRLHHSKRNGRACGICKL